MSRDFIILGLAILLLVPSIAGGSDQASSVQSLLLPFQIEIAKDSTVAAIAAQPWPMNSIRILRPDGTEKYIGANRIRSIRDAQGNDWKHEVLDLQKRVGVTLSEYQALQASGAASAEGACLSLIALRVPPRARIEVMGWRGWKEPIASLDLRSQVRGIRVGVGDSGVVEISKPKAQEGRIVGKLRVVRASALAEEIMRHDFEKRSGSGVAMEDAAPVWIYASTEGRLQGVDAGRGEITVTATDKGSTESWTIAASEIREVHYWEKGHASALAFIFGGIVGGFVGARIGEAADPPDNDRFVDFGGAPAGALIGVGAGAILFGVLSATVPSERTMECR